MVRLYQELKMKQQIWSEENLQRYLDELQKPNAEENKRPREGQCELFYIDPVENLLQNEIMIAVIINYMGYNIKPDVLLEKTLSFDKPVFRIQAMIETSPASGTFNPITLDLLEQMILRKDINLLSLLYEHIDFEKYANHKEPIELLLGSDFSAC